MASNGVVRPGEAAPPSTASSVSGRRRFTSLVWTNFSHHAAAGPGEEDWAICRRCGARLRANGATHGTSHLARHIGSRKCATQAATQQDVRVRPYKGDFFGMMCEELVDERQEGHGEGDRVHGAQGPAHDAGQSSFLRMNAPDDLDEEQVRKFEDYEDTMVHPHLAGFYKAGKKSPGW